MYRYRFARGGEPGYWNREYMSDVLRPRALTDPELQEYLRRRGWAPLRTSDDTASAASP